MAQLGPCQHMKIQNFIVVYNLIVLFMKLFSIMGGVLLSAGHLFPDISEISKNTENEMHGFQSTGTLTQPEPCSHHIQNLSEIQSNLKGTSSFDHMWNLQKGSGLIWEVFFFLVCLGKGLNWQIDRLDLYRYFTGNSNIAGHKLH